MVVSYCHPEFESEAEKDDDKERDDNSDGMPDSDHSKDDSEEVCWQLGSRRIV